VRTLKVSKVSAVALVASLAMASSVVAQQQTTQQTTLQPRPAETALDFALRANVCTGASAVSAEYIDGGNLVQVRCPGTVAAGADGMAGGLGDGGVAAAAAGGAVLVAVALAGGGSSSTTTTTGAN